MFAVAIGVGAALFVVFLASCAERHAEATPAEDVPTDVPLVPRASIVDLRTSTLGFQAVLETSNGLDEVADWYAKTLPAKGWEWLGRTPETAPGEPILLSARTAGRYLTVTVRDPGEGKKRQVTVNYLKEL
jgi:hypothetical protein